MKFDDPNEAREQIGMRRWGEILTNERELNNAVQLFKRFYFFADKSSPLMELMDISNERSDFNDYIFIVMHMFGDYRYSLIMYRAAVVTNNYRLNNIYTDY